MSNETLRDALDQAGITQEQLADEIQVDVRTVRRWLAGGVPHARQRARVARVLDREQAELWPELAFQPPTQPRRASEPVDSYLSLSQPGAPGPVQLIADAHQQIDLFSHNLHSTLRAVHVTELLAARAGDGCRVRLLLQNPNGLPAALVDQPDIEIRVLQSELLHTLYRCDQQLLLVLYAGRDDAAEHAPLFHITRNSAPQLFDHLAQHYDLLWDNTATRPLNPDHDVPQHHTDPPQVAAAPTKARRWPRQPPSR
jgi:transcriptional regulator with XRE-family HTH domain